MDPKLFRMYSNILNEQAATPVQGVTGQKLAQTSGGQFMNRADRTNQAKVDAALGPGFKAGTAAANMALAKKFSQGAPAAPAAPDTRGAAALASKSAPATQQTTPDSYPTTSAVTAQSIGATNLQGEDPAQQNTAATGTSSYTNTAGAALGAEPPTEPGSNLSSYTSAGGAALGAGGQTAKPASGGLVDGSGRPVTSGSGQQVKTGFSEEELEEGSAEELEELAEMMRLSGLALNEKAVSKQQQKFMGMVHAMQKGEKVKGASAELKKAAKGMSKSDARDFAKTKHKGLPQKVDESFKLMLDEEGHTLEHIVNRFKHEVKAFLSGDYMAENLYDALYDYYLDRGEMPYGVAKAREGDPYTWVSARFEADIDGTVDVKVPLGEVGHDDTLNELARLAGLSESRVDECGDMGMDQRDTINVSTNMSSDGNKSVNISAQGEKAEELLSMLKLAGMDGQSMNKPAIVAISSDEEMMDEERETQYANTPEEEYQTVASITRQGNDLNREKKQFANMPKAGDNPMATDYMLDEELSALLDSVLVKEAEPRRPKGDTGQAEIFTADLGIQPPSPDEGPVGKSPIAPKAPATPKAPVVTPGIKR